MKLEDLIKLNPKLILKKGVPAPFIEMAALPTNEKFIREIGQRKAIGSGAKFQNGDTLFARITPCLENGKGGYVSGLPDGVVGQGSTEFIVLRARKKSDEQFAYYLSRFQKFRSFAEKGMEGTSGRQRVTWQTLADFELPDLSEMQRAALGDVLGSLDDKIELNRRMNETLEEMARALFRDWFIDFGPTRRQMDGATDPAAIMGHAFSNAKAAALAPLFPATFAEGGLPKGWIKGILESIANSPRRGIHPTDVAENTPYIGLEHMPRRSIALSQWEGAGKVTSNKSVFKKGDLLFGKLRPYFHKVGRAPVDGICSTDIVVISPKSKEWDAFVTSCLSSDSFVEYTNKTTTGTRMPRTNWKIMAQYAICLPPEPIARAFQDTVEPLLNMVHSNIHETHTLAQIRDLLLPKLISGEIQLKDAPMVQDTLDEAAQIFIMPAEIEKENRRKKEK